MLIRFFLFFIISLALTSCKNDSKIKTEIASIDVNFVVERFDINMLNATPKDLPKLKGDYPFLFSKNIPDSVWIARITDTLQIEILEEVEAVFKDFKAIKSDLGNMFKHLRYYDKNFKLPRVITLTNTVDYRKKNVVNDSLVLIALDNYLGESHRFYNNIPKYIGANLKQNQIVVDIAERYAEQYTFQAQRKSFLDDMIYFGKLLYFKDLILPDASEYDKISYTKDQLQWAKNNESAIWSYFVEKELLFSTDNKLSNRFITNAPFSKFYLELDSESPGKIGQYVGWKIVRAYAENTNADLFSILQTEPDIIFKASKFKPKK